MRLLLVVVFALVLVQPAGLLCSQTPPSLALPSYTLHIPDLRVALISPNEEDLAVLVMRWTDVPLTMELQVWDFRKGALMKAHRLPAPEVRPGYPRGTAYLCYTTDRKLLAVYTGGDQFHVLRATNLEEVRTVRIQSQMNIDALQVSPTDHSLAVRMSGDVRVYDLDSGEETRTWRINQHPEFKMSELLKVDPQLNAPGLAWRGDGGALAVSVADNPPCMRGGGTIYVLDPSSNKKLKIFRVPLLPASIAFGSGNTLYVASNTCGGYFTHWALDLPMFDSDSGRQIGKIPASAVGFRGNIAISANKRMLLAHVDHEKTTFEGFEDTLKTSEEQWQLWDLAAPKLVLTFLASDSETLGPSPSLSSSGHFVYAYGGKDLKIFPVPMAEK